MVIPALSNKRLRLALIVFFVWTLIALLVIVPTRQTAHAHSASRSYFHLLIPASQPNANLCRLIYSAAVLNYPAPILIGWEGKDDYDITASHLAKIRGIIRYLKGLPEGRQDDVALVLDGYDVWMQLRPDVLLQRYFKVNADANAQLEEDFGKEGMKEHGVMQSIIFGPDKICWPEDPWRPACWAVPKSPLGRKIFGVTTDGEDPVYNRPRWLNSGTLIGPTGDLHEALEATMRVMAKEFDPNNEIRNSDQMYFADTWGEQEWGRTSLFRILKGDENATNARRQPPPDLEHTYVPKFEPGQKTDFHIGLDYESSLFQTAAFYEEFLTWMTYSGRPHITADSPATESAEYIQEAAGTTSQPLFLLPEDVSFSPPPPLPPVEDTPGTPWTSLRLMTNYATHQLFPVLHITGNKELIEAWWRRMWFYPHGLELLDRAHDYNPFEEGKGLNGGQLGSGDLYGNREWWNWNVRESAPTHWWGGAKSLPSTLLGQIKGGKKGGAWTDSGKWIAWEDLCGPSEGELFS
ncbi:hypothetical protein K402DRAFT_448405 [Aulographum hederae CBS 113979]|uniref:Uncharacterized protein n=1 Tax=Aulographum hederae CBS 113979 TaxID=1176131 RepID=A0A6G1GQ73_9PEZI|nr:hypothetical protein K402DRAFT_448405 [Aulographum hederae CBS 113979]